MLISIDPGIRACGVAIWKGDILHKAGLVRGLKSNFDAEVWLAIADAVEEFTGEESIDTLVTELPQVYTRDKSKGDPNDLIQLAAAVGSIITRMNCQKNIVYRPAQWKNQLPKNVMVERIKARLSDVEMKRVFLPAKSLEHNVFDAIGIGLHHLMRRGPVSVPDPGPTSSSPPPSSPA